MVSLSKKIAYILCFVAGLILGLLLCYLRVLPQLILDFSWLHVFDWSNVTTDFLSDLAAFEGVLIGVSIPIALQAITLAVGKYEDNEIAQFFTDEPYYRAQYFLLIPNIATAILLRFLNTNNVLVLSFMFIWLIVNLLIFLIFIRLVHQYTTNLDGILLGKLNKIVEEVFEE